MFVCSEKIEKLKKDTEDLVNKKIEDALKNIGHRRLNDIEESPPQSQTDDDLLNTTVIDVG